MNNSSLTLSSSAGQARWILRVFYGFILLFVINDVPSFLANRYGSHPDLLWPVLWLKWVPFETGVNIILAFFLLSALTTALAPQWRVLRIAGFLGLLQFLALKYSYGKIGHSMHLWLSVSAILIFLPKGWQAGEHAEEAVQRRLLQLFALIQSFILLTYTLSGLGKVLIGSYQWILGEYHAFHPMALSLHTADRLWQTDLRSVLGEFVVEHPYWFWPFFIFTIYVQFCAFFVSKRPELHRIWGFFLISMHIGIASTMGIFFNEAIFILFLFLILSPFDHKQFSISQRILAFPGIRWKKSQESMPPL